MEPLVFINIGWMKRYQGPSPTDELEPGNFGYFKKNKSRNAVGHEQWNFVDRDGWVYGYVPRSSGINITRLGANKDQDELEGVLVIFVARDPAAQELKVVGWYRNATVSRSIKFSRRFGRVEVETPIAALASGSYVLPVARRDVIVPTAQKTPGGFGQSPVWYAESHPDLVRHVRMLVAGDTSSFPKSSKHGRKSIGGAPRNPDPKTRLAVEKLAMDWAMSYFDDAEDVSRECKGWDIEAKADGVTVLIEVKGLSGPAVAVELTPNEYEQMGKEKRRYLLFIVTSALTKQPLARTFRINPSSAKGKISEWVSDLGEVLKIQERIGARAAL